MTGPYQGRYRLARLASPTRGDIDWRRGRFSPDGVSPDERQALATLDAIRHLAQSGPTIYLPAHDPRSASRLADGQMLHVLKAPDPRSGGDGAMLL